MSEQRRILLAVGAEALEPGGEGGVKACSFRLRHARVRDVSRQCVFERELLLAGHRRRAVAADEVAPDKHAHVGLDAAEKLEHGGRPEDTSDDGRRLQRRLLRRTEEIDTSREDGLDRIGNRKPVLQVSELPASSSSDQVATVDQRGDELFQEERIALGLLQHERPESRREPVTEELLEHSLGLLVRERLEPEPGGVAMPCSPAGTAGTKR